ncbi:MAG: hypothetical protein QW189_01880 [Thermofilaceae archaeon]
MRARQAALISVFSALAIAARLLKHALAGTLQFVNIPLIAAMVAAHVGGSLVGALTGVLSFLGSDAVLGLGPWTLVNSSLAGLIGAAWGSIDTKNSSSVRLFVFAFLLVFLYDVVSSFALYVLFIGDARVALLYALVGLFFPVMGGYMVGIGPLTELVTAASVTLLINRINRIELPLLR